MMKRLVVFYIIKFMFKLMYLKRYSYSSSKRAFSDYINHSAEKLFENFCTYFRKMVTCSWNFLDPLLDGYELKQYILLNVTVKSLTD